MSDLLKQDKSNKDEKIKSFHILKERNYLPRL